MKPIWLFDLDNTLHNASAHIFPHINRAMTAYLAEHLQLSLEAAGVLRNTYWRRYGATLRGMMRNHGTRPRHFLHATHQFEDLRSMLVFDHALLAHLKHLPGLKVIFSNAPRPYVEAVLRLTGLNQVIDRVFTVDDLKFHPKPQIRAYRHVLRQLKVAARHCIMVEDTAENLRPAKRLGMRTLWISQARKTPVWVDQRLRSARAIRIFNTTRG